MTDTTLLPCPFCGARAETDFIRELHSYQIECRDVFGCSARVVRDSELHAAEAWNRRAPADALPPELTSIARPTSTAAVEVAAPSGAAREPLADEQIEKLCAEIGFTNWPEWDGGTFQEMWMQLARAIEAAHGITAAQKGGNQ